MPISIFEYDDLIEFLNAVFQRKQVANPRFSLRAWTRQIGLDNPGQLSMVLSGKRKASPALSRKLRLSLGLTGDEERYFDLLVLRAGASTTRQRLFYEAGMTSLKPGREHKEIAADVLATISNWYHLVIMEMTFLAGFTASPEWIAERLKFEVTVDEVAAALARLLRLGLLAWTETGRLVKAERNLKTTNDIPSNAVRSLHRGMIHNAEQALLEDPLEERDITAHVIATRSDKLEQAKAMVRQFRFDLARLLEEDGPCDAIFTINVQMFNSIRKAGAKT